MNTKSIRIGNLFQEGEVCGILKKSVMFTNGNNCKSTDLTPIVITEELLINVGFYTRNNDAVIRGIELLLQVNEELLEDGTINRDGSWFNAIGVYGTTNGEMGVSVICKGNYICNNIYNYHSLQNMYYTLSNEELKIKT